MQNKGSFIIHAKQGIICYLGMQNMGLFVNHAKQGIICYSCKTKDHLLFMQNKGSFAI